MTATARTFRRPARLRTALLALPIAATALLGGLASPAEAATANAAAQRPLTCQGQGIDPTAKLHYQTQIFIKAPLSVVWRTHTDVAAWPKWQAAVTSMKPLTPGPMRPGSRFLWTTPAPATASTPATTLDITSTVQDVRPGQCTRWMGPAIGEGLRIDRGTHVWNFIKVPGGVIVRTEESWTGAQIEADPATAIRYLAPGLDQWLADLKAASEARVCQH
ncbi:SRPBCC family protein [Catenulispora sp. NL8]|uniref:SRPBCC family protein n=1 Tax=Catenulispora pinistramenti TaxID=2705254 RepID=A0ABS5L2Y1_9ACTN|nr:SRPBCC family protein [Catenulispora pinistramenti]MBS2552701.1 SRPBCC family protein [Catenulispora pinistramenti]